MSKTCTRCGEEKSLDSYYNDKNTKDKHRCECKSCMGKRRDDYRKKYPEKFKVHIQTTSALTRGKIISEPCEICGDEKSQAHHDDYNKPLDIRWLCIAHHNKHHKALHVELREVVND